MTGSQNAVPSEVIDKVDSVEVRELRGEILALREYQKEQTDTTSELLTELQRRCDQIIDLEVQYEADKKPHLGRIFITTPKSTLVPLAAADSIRGQVLR